MLSTLVKKQLKEVLNVFFAGNKKKKRSALGKLILAIIVLGGIGGSIFALASAFGPILVPTDMCWLYFSIMAIVALLVGTFGSIFSTYYSLFKANDNETLLSMPIAPWKIICSRMIGVAMTAFVFVAIIWIPTIIRYFVDGPKSALSVVFCILMLFVLTALVTCLSCFFGWIVAIVRAKIKSKIVITIILGAVILGVIYFMNFRMQAIIAVITENPANFAKAFEEGPGYPLYVSGKACCGDALTMLIVFASAAILLLVCYFIMSKTFITIATTKGSNGKAELKEKDAHSKLKTNSKALLGREFTHLKKSTSWLLNAGFGIIVFIIAGVMMLLKAGTIREIIPADAATQPIYQVIIVCMTAVIILFTSMLLFTAPSVALEGKTLWRIKTLPVDMKDVLMAKVKMHLIIVILPVLFAAFSACYVLSLGVGLTIIVCLTTVIYAFFSAYLGLTFGLRNPKFDWTSESIPVKQSSAVVFTMFGGWLLAIIIGALYILLMFKFNVEISASVYLAVVAILFAVAAILLRKYLRGKGAIKLENL